MEHDPIAARERGLRRVRRVTGATTAAATGLAVALGAVFAARPAASAKPSPTPANGSPGIGPSAKSGANPSTGPAPPIELPGGTSDQRGHVRSRSS